MGLRSTSGVPPSVAGMIAAETLRQEADNSETSSLFIADLKRASMAVQEWEKRLPDVKPLYAMKCNPDPELIKKLIDLDVGIDSASPNELECAVDTGALPGRIIYTNPIKTSSSLDTARVFGVKTLIFDNVEELLKIKKWTPNAELLLRGSRRSFGDDQLQFEVWRTGAKDPRAFSRAVHSALEIAQRGKLDLRILDLGGGFTDSNFAAFAEHLRPAIAYARHMFPHVQVIAEPGQYLACPSFTICCQVIGRGDAEPPRLYVNDGVFGNFIDAYVEQEKYQPAAIVRQRSLYDQGRTGKRVYSTWGQTCDSMDRIAAEACFDREVRVGDWLLFADMGAYTSVCQTRFNGFDATRTPTLYVG